MHNSILFDALIKTEGEIIELVNKVNRSQYNCLITYMNQHCYNIYSADNHYKAAINNYFNTYIDGIGIFLTLKIFGYRSIKKFNASDLNEKIIGLLVQNNSAIYIIGGNFSSNLINQSKASGIKIVGYKNGYDDVKDTKGLIYDIKKLNPEAIVIGMGVPKQEYLAIQISENLSGKLIICVGNFLEFYFGTIKRIPGAFRNLGIEWIYRMASEPKRLWKRYIIGIPVFLYFIMKEYFVNKD